MNSVFADNNHAANNRKHRTYANTVLRGNTRAVFGDVSQDVNFSGGLHLHFHTPFQAINLAGSITQFLHFSDRLLQIGKRLANSTIPVYDSFCEFTALSKSLSDIIYALKIEQERWQSEEVASHPSNEKALRELLTLALNDAKILHMLLQPVTQDIECHLFASCTNSNTPIRTIPSWSKSNKGRTYESQVKHSPDFPINKILTTETRERLSQAVQLKYNLRSAQTLFTTLWQKYRLEDRLSRFSLYCDLLNKRLNAVLNTRLDKPHHDLAAESTLHKIGTNKMRHQKSDIVEVLSINQHDNNLLQSVAAILTRQNGDTETLTSQIVDRNPANGFANTSFMKYKLTAESTAEDKQRRPLIEDAPQFVKLITSALYYREESQRQSQVAEAHQKTFGWIFEEGDAAKATKFPKWLKEGNHCFWINGKAGSGKSTLMKYILNNALLHEMLSIWAGSRQLILGIFFFWSAGTSLQQSYEGVLRSLLHQVLQERPELTPIVFPQIIRHILCSKDDQIQKIALEELQEGVLLLAKNMPSNLALFLMIDGIDEYSGNHFEFAKFIESLAQYPSVKILVSSRPIPACYQIFSYFPSLRVQDLTIDDMRAYINAQLLTNQLMIDMDNLEPGFAGEVEQALTEKSSGVFLWLVIVVRKLIIGLGNYDDRNSLVKQIDDLPNDLERQYDHMFGQMSRDYQRDGSQILQLLCHAQKVQDKPLTAVQLFEALKEYRDIKSTPAALSSNYKQEALRIKAIEGKLRSRCCDLVEVVKRSSSYELVLEPEVEFLHRTVYDYLKEKQVQARLQEMHQMEVHNVNLSLLASSVHMLKRRMLFNLQFGATWQIIKRYFVACLIYSDELNDAAGTEFLDLFAEAHASFFEYCGRPRERSNFRNLYAEAYRDNALLHGFEFHEINEHILEVVRSDMYAVLLIAQFGPTKYFARRVKAQTWNKSLLLSFLLNLSVEHPSSPLAQQHKENIETLLTHGSDPNVWDKNYLYQEWVAHKICGAAASLDRNRRFVPWNFWILKCDINETKHLEITLLLIKAGAKIYDPVANVEKISALLALKNKLQKFCLLLKKVGKTRQIWL